MFGCFVLYFGREKRLPIAEGQEDFLIIISWIVRGFDDQETVLSGVGAAVKIEAGHGVRVIPARAGRARGELIAAAAARRDHRRAFLLGAVHVGRNEQAVPVNELGDVGVVDDVHGDGHALAHAQEGRETFRCSRWC